MLQNSKGAQGFGGESPVASASGLELRFDGARPQPLARTVPVEMAIRIVYAPVPYAVMMASPQDLRDFVFGFSLTEGVIDRADDIRAVEISRLDAGIEIRVTLASDSLTRHLGRARAMTGRTGCGICGIEDMKHLPNAPLRAKSGPPVQVRAIHRALLALEDGQKLNLATHAVHGAAFVDMNGEILVLREDVGRHNALDKMIGAAMQQKVDAGGGFVLITSRCSFEMVEKAAMFGARCLVAISAPTSLAIERAKQHDMGLMAIARPDGGIIFHNAAMFADASGVDAR
ncbi:MAG: formate dehydrogenase accessory sulfurtransferase FdhD [Hyphomicrobiales bacterium]|nr:formate dehydrogenase accessory sulfurtransferase FdhD [Hyphomicrobiales bacterium]MDE2115574.1 formate dehydrogenase accessory sulfurtransferase FdhD [Hyphomicrobiales bacterium]